MIKVVAMVQARLGSSRLPGKMLMDVAGQPLLLRTLERAKAIPGVDTVVLVTTTVSEDQRLLELAGEAGVPGFAGSAEDVLDRYYSAAKQHGAGVIMRLTGDCPLLDPSVCGLVNSRFAQGDVDYASNVQPPTYPDGLDAEVFSFHALETAWREATLKTDREHVTQFMLRHLDRFRSVNTVGSKDLSHLRWTVDETEDLDFIRLVYQGLERRGWQGHGHDHVLQVIQEDGLQDNSERLWRNQGLLKTMREDGLASPVDSGINRSS